MRNFYDVIHPAILQRWQEKYGEYLTAYKSDEWVIFCENGRLDCFHPSGDRLARHHIPSGKTIYIWNNNVNELLTENEYMIKMMNERR